MSLNNKAILKYAIVGFGGAGYNALKAIREHDLDGEIDIYSEHFTAPYNPMLTTYYASGKLKYTGMFPFGSLEDINNRYNANIFSGVKVEKINGKLKTIVLSDGTIKQYDKILISTGATAFIPPIINECPENTIYMRTVEDAIKLKEILDSNKIKSAVVIGASMVGIKVVEALINNGITTTMIDMAPYIFPLAAYETTAHKIQTALERKSIKMRFGTGLSAIKKGTSTPIDVQCSDGSIEHTDIIVLCIGTRANTSILDPLEIQITKGIVVDTNMQTSCEGIFAAGDCCEGNNIQDNNTAIIGLWANAIYQGYTAGSSMSGNSKPFDGNIFHNITHFCDMDFIGYGDVRIKGSVITFENINKGIWIEAVKVNDVLAGINILGNYRISGILKNLILDIMSSKSGHLSDMQIGILVREGIDLSFIAQLEGV